MFTTKTKKEGHRKQEIQPKAKGIPWRIVEGDPGEQSVQTGAVVIKPFAAITHSSPDDVLYESKGVNQRRESLEMQDI